MLLLDELSNCGRRGTVFNLFFSFFLAASQTNKGWNRFTFFPSVECGSIGPDLSCECLSVVEFCFNFRIILVVSFAGKKEKAARQIRASCAWIVWLHCTYSSLQYLEAHKCGFKDQILSPYLDVQVAQWKEKMYFLALSEGPNLLNPRKNTGNRHSNLNNLLQYLFRWTSFSYELMNALRQIKLARSVNAIAVAAACKHSQK